MIAPLSHTVTIDAKQSELSETLLGAVNNPFTPSDPKSPILINEKIAILSDSEPRNDIQRLSAQSTPISQPSANKPYGCESLAPKIKALADTYQVSYVELIATLKYESGCKHEGVWGRAGEYGIAQYMPGTFTAFAREARLENADWKDMDDQLELTAWAFMAGKQCHWTAWRKLFNYPNRC